MSVYYVILFRDEKKGIFVALGRYPDNKKLAMAMKEEFVERYKVPSSKIKVMEVVG